MPKSKARLKEELLALWDRGILTDPRLVVRATEYGTMEEVLVDLELDTAQAVRENERMARGELVKVEDFHNHMVHIMEHNRFRKTEEYEKLPDNIKEVFARHVEEHKRFIPPEQVQQPQGKRGE
jgi:Txe/YoeB family toxin of Txe-Axe toxin-antitoxin module